MTKDRRRASISLERLKEKIDSITTNIAIYTDHMDRYKKELRDEYGLTTKEAAERLKEIDKETRSLVRKEKKLHRDASEILDDMKEDEDGS